MRKNAPRKWIHAILDLLPLFVIPIFAININQKSVEPISITIDESWTETNLKYQTNVVESTNDLIVGNIYNLTFNERPTNSSYIDILQASAIYNLNVLGNTNKVESEALGTSHIKIRFTQDYLLISNSNYATIFIDSWTGKTYPYTFSYVYYAKTSDYNTYFNDIPSTESDYQVFETINHEEEPVIYDNTDIGSQFLYSIYKPVNDYFNFNNLFNMNDVWNWIQLNLFSGSAPLPVFIVWNIILYEFFIDLIFLMYSVFMFVIDFASDTLENFMAKSRGCK